MSEERVLEQELELEEVVEVEEKVNWKLAGKKLKEAVADMSIDRYYKRKEIADLRERYNAKERTQELYDRIMGV